VYPRPGVVGKATKSALAQLGTRAGRSLQRGQTCLARWYDYLRLVTVACYARPAQKAGRSAERVEDSLVILAPRDIDASVAPGETALAWLNSHSSILLMTSGATLVIDPVGVTLPRQVRPDAVVVTHSHIDHFDRALLAHWQEDTAVRVLTSPFVAARMSRKPNVLRVGDRASIGDLELLAERCEHHATEPLSLVISGPNTPTIFHPADSDPFADMARLRKEHEPQVMLFTGPSMRKALEIARLIQPRMLVSCDCDDDWEDEFTLQAKCEVPQTEVKFLRPLEIFRFRAQ